MAEWKYGTNEVQQYYELNSCGAPGTYALVFRNHGQRQWFGMVENAQGGLETLIDRNATETLRTETGRDCDILGGPFCMLSSDCKDVMMRACENALSTGDSWI